MSIFSELSSHFADAARPAPAHDTVSAHDANHRAVQDRAAEPDGTDTENALSKVARSLGFDAMADSLSPHNQAGYAEQRQALAPPKHAVTTTRLNMREAPAAAAAKVMTLGEGEGVAVLQSAGDWLAVNARGQTGFCHADYLEVTARNPEPASASEPVPEMVDQEDDLVSVEDDGATSDAPLKTPKPADFKTRKYQPSTKKNPKKPGTESPATLTSGVLKQAGQNPETWYGSFTKPTFLGRAFSQPIHTALATHLAKSEQSILAAHGKEGESPAEVGDRIGMSRNPVVGSRKEPTAAAVSMHLFGLAIDIDPKSHRYLKKKAGKGKRSVRDVSNGVFESAGKLLRGGPVKYKASEDFAEQEAFDVLLEEYFALLDLDDQGLSEKLAKGSGDWVSLSPADARARISKELDQLAWAWHGKNGWKANRERVKEEGLMNYSEALVSGLDLHWGAAYGDLMHFDMRNTGIGKKLHRARGAYKGKQKKSEG